MSIRCSSNLAGKSGLVIWCKAPAVALYVWGPNPSGHRWVCKGCERDCRNIELEGIRTGFRKASDDEALVLEVLES